MIQIDDAEEAYALALGDRLAAEGRGQVSLAGAGPADKDDVTGAAQIGSGVELADLSLVDDRLVEVEAVQIARHREARQADLILVRASSPISHLRLQKLREPARRGELLLTQCRQALLQGAGHPSQPQRLHLCD